MFHMKKNTFLFASLLLGAAALLSACNGEKLPTGPVTASDGEGTVNIHLFVEGSPQTKAPSTTVLNGEETVNRVDLFLFKNGTDAQGVVNPIARYFTATSLTDAQWYTDGAGSGKGPVTLPVGDYIAWVVVNGYGWNSTDASVYPAVAKEADLLALDHDLAAFNKDGSGFIMAGTKTFTVTVNTDVSVALNVSRLVSRVRLLSITDNLSGPLSFTLEGMFLQNVPQFAGVLQEGDVHSGVRTIGYYNPEGYKGGSVAYSLHTNVISRSSANFSDIDANALTAVDGAAWIAMATNYSDPHTAAAGCMYSYENMSTVKIGKNATGTTYSLVQPVLTVYGQVTGQGRKFYNIPLNISPEGKFWPSGTTFNPNGLRRNYTYDINLTINNVGTDDTHTELELGSVDVAIEVNPWVAGNEYTPNM